MFFIDDLICGALDLMGDAVDFAGNSIAYGVGDAIRNAEYDRNIRKNEYRIKSSTDFRIGKRENTFTECVKDPYQYAQNILDKHRRNLDKYLGVPTDIQPRTIQEPVLRLEENHGCLKSFDVADTEYNFNQAVSYFSKEFTVDEAGARVLKAVIVAQLFMSGLIDQKVAYKSCDDIGHIVMANQLVVLFSDYKLSIMDATDAPKCAMDAYDIGTGDGALKFLKTAKMVIKWEKNFIIDHSVDEVHDRVSTVHKAMKAIIKDNKLKLSPSPASPFVYTNPGSTPSFSASFNSKEDLKRKIESAFGQLIDPAVTGKQYQLNVLDDYSAELLIAQRSQMYGFVTPRALKVDPGFVIGGDVHVHAPGTVAGNSKGVWVNVAKYPEIVRKVLNDETYVLTAAETKQVLQGQFKDQRIYDCIDMTDFGTLVYNLKQKEFAAVEKALSTVANLNWSSIGMQPCRLRLYQWDQTDPSKFILISDGNCKSPFAFIFGYSSFINDGLTITVEVGKQICLQKGNQQQTFMIV